MSTSGDLPPLPDPATPRSTSRTAPTTTAPTSTAPTSASSGTCGTVTAASGMTLRVLLGSGVTDCALAERVVAAFHHAIAGKQPAGSARPAGADVDGWHCVSGPPAAQGGTDCSQNGRNVQAAVVGAE
ncbi:MAG: hypothetical protein ACRDQW_00235 [Haloechinothrix sp.]